MGSHFFWVLVMFLNLEVVTVSHQSHFFGNVGHERVDPGFP